MAWRSGQAYGQDLRERVLGAPGSVNAVAQRFGVSASYVARVRSRQRKLGQNCAQPQCNHVLPRLQGMYTQLLAKVQEAPDQTLQQLCQWAEREHGVRVGTTTMWKTLGRLGLSLKKRPFTPASKSART